MHKRFWSLLAGCGLAVLSIEATAAVFRLSVDTSLAHFQKDSYDLPEAEGGETVGMTTFGFGEGGFPPDQETIQPTLGFRMGFGVFFKRHFTFGMIVGLNGGRMIHSVELDGHEEKDKASLLGYAFLPFFSYKFDTGRVSPFFTVLLGYGGSRFTIDDLEDYKLLTHNFVFGGSVGVHIFITNAVSFDTGIQVTGRVGRVVSVVTNLNTDTTVGERREKYPHRGIQTNLILGLTAWF
jgi:hypothetical protein